MGFDPTKIGAQYRYLVSSITTGAAFSVQRMCQANPYRVGILMSTPNSFQFGVTSGITNLTGITVPSNAFQTLSLAQHGPLVQQEIWVTCATATTPIGCLEILWLPP